MRGPGRGHRTLDGLLILRFDGPLYTANIRSVNRRVVEQVDRRPGTRVVVLDVTAQGQLTTTIIDEGMELDRALAERGVELWLAALTPEALRVATELSSWANLVATGRAHPTALAAVRAYLDARAVSGR